MHKLQNPSHKNSAIQLICILLLLHFCSCSGTKKTGFEINKNDANQILDLVIDNILEVNENWDYCIYPEFYSGLPEKVIYDSFLSEDQSNFDSTQVATFIQQLKSLEGKDLSRHIIDPEKQMRISETFDEFLIILSAPMIDEKNGIVVIYVEIQFPNKNEEVEADARFIMTQLKKEKAGSEELMYASLIKTFKPVIR